MEPDGLRLCGDCGRPVEGSARRVRCSRCCTLVCSRCFYVKHGTWWPFASCAPSERIVRAAILFDGAVWSVEAPGRHHDVIRAYVRTKGVNSIPPRTEEQSVQGFVTSTGRFVDRVEAARLAFDAGQISRAKRGLFSEDVW